MRPSPRTLAWAAAVAASIVVLSPPTAGQSRPPDDVKLRVEVFGHFIAAAAEGKHLELFEIQSEWKENVIKLSWNDWVTKPKPKPTLPAWAREDSQLFMKLATPESDLWQAATKRNLRGIERDGEEKMKQQGLNLATSVWTNLRTGRGRVPADKPITLDLAVKSVSDLVLVTLKSKSGGVLVKVDGVPRGKTAVDRYLTKGQEYSVEFELDGKTSTKSFTPSADGDTCDGDL